MLPFYEQGPLYNTYNMLTDVTDPSNITVAGVGISSLWCPSDPAMATKLNLSGPDPMVSPRLWEPGLATPCRPERGTKCSQTTATSLDALASHTSRLRTASSARGRHHARLSHRRNKQHHAPLREGRRVDSAIRGTIVRPLLPLESFRSRSG